MADISISLPDGTQRSLAAGATAATLAESIGSRLAKAAVAAVVNGAEADLTAPLPDGATVAIITADSDAGRHVLRHSTAHVMAQAVTQLFPGAKFSIGPAIADGFYYDFELPGGRTFLEADLAAIEARMRDIVKADQAFVRDELPAAKALELFADQPYKVEIIKGVGGAEDAAEGGGADVVSYYRNRPDFVDLCRGPRPLLHLGREVLPEERDGDGGIGVFDELLEALPGVGLRLDQLVIEAIAVLALLALDDRLTAQRRQHPTEARLLLHIGCRRHDGLLGRDAMDLGVPGPVASRPAPYQPGAREWAHSALDPASVVTEWAIQEPLAAPVLGYLDQPILGGEPIRARVPSPREEARVPHLQPGHPTIVGGLPDELGDTDAQHQSPAQELAQLRLVGHVRPAGGEGVRQSPRAS